MGEAVRLLVLVVLLLASPAWAMSPAELDRGLEADAGWAENVAAARRAEAARDVELIPSMFAGFVASKRGTLREDPDIHERLLIALEQWPVGTVIERLKQASIPAEMSVSRREYHAWLDLLASDDRGFSSLRVVQGDGLNVFLGGGRVELSPRPTVAVPGGDADQTAVVPSFAIPQNRLPPHPDARWPWVLAGLLGVLVGLVVLAGKVRSTRRVVFPLLAVLLAPVLVLTTEVLLIVGGVEPLAAVRPNFNLGGGSAGMRWFQPVGTDLETVKNNARYQRFSQEFSGLRVLALGGSSVRGKGDLVEYAWPSVLERRLRACSPAETPVEVINAGADGALSDDLAVVAGDLAETGPDVIVVYAGYNDFVFVPLLTRFAGYSPERMGLRYQLGRTRIAHIGARWLGRLELSPAVESKGPASTPSNEAVRDMRTLLANNLSQNLRRIARVGHGIGAKVIFVTQGQNESLCGAGSLNGQESWDRACFPSDARRTVMQAASAEGVTVVDAAAALRADAGGVTVGWSHFWDTIHPGRRGSGVIGEAVATTIVDMVWTQAISQCDEAQPAR